MFRFQIFLLVSAILAGLIRDAHSECKISDDKCEFWLDIENRLTMMYKRDAVYAYKGKLYLYNVPENETDNATPINPDEVIVTDGWEVQGLVITANGTMPGPPIEVYEGQEVVIHVRNHLSSDSITIHWHGLHQSGTPWMDGVAFVTQCPIPPGTSFTYRFKAKPRGTFWYHSHIGAQLGMGLVGAFIIREKKAMVMEEFIMMLQDWNHDWDSDVSHMRMNYGNFWNRKRLPNTDSLEGGHFSAYTFQSGLINGKGRAFMGTDNFLTQTPLEIYPVENGKQYRFRVIGSGILYPFRVSVDNHTLKLVASDGYDIQPVQIESFIINPGERYDFIIEANQLVENYWVRAETLEINVKNHVALAILRYKGAADVDPVFRPRPCTADNRCVVVNCPYSYYPQDQYTDCKLYSEMNAMYLDPTPGSDDDEDVEDVFLNFAFPGITTYPGSTNGRHFKKSASPPLTQPKQADTVCRPEHNCGEQKQCKCALSLDLKYGKTYQFIMMNMGNGKGWAHPIHMHGHSFHVVKMGYPTYNKTTGRLLEDTKDINCGGNVSYVDSFCNKASWANSSWAGNNIPGLKLMWAPRKDTIIVPTGGYAVVRFKADNPGVWFVHCHIELHNLDGMALMLNESFERQASPPHGFPTCGNFEYLKEGPKEEFTTQTTVNVTKAAIQRTRVNDDDDCVDNEIFWPVVVCLIAVIVIQFFILLCMFRVRPLDKANMADLPETGAHSNNAYSIN